MSTAKAYPSTLFLYKKPDLTLHYRGQDFKVGLTEVSSFRKNKFLYELRVSDPMPEVPTYEGDVLRQIAIDLGEGPLFFVAAKLHVKLRWIDDVLHIKTLVVGHNYVMKRILEATRALKAVYPESKLKIVFPQPDVQSLVALKGLAKDIKPDHVSIDLDFLYMLDTILDLSEVTKFSSPRLCIGAHTKAQLDFLRDFSGRIQYLSTSVDALDEKVCGPFISLTTLKLTGDSHSPVVIKDSLFPLLLELQCNSYVPKLDVRELDKLELVVLSHYHTAKGLLSDRQLAVRSSNFSSSFLGFDSVLYAAARSGKYSRIEMVLNVWHNQYTCTTSTITLDYEDDTKTL